MTDSMEQRNDDERGNSHFDFPLQDSKIVDAALADAIPLVNANDSTQLPVAISAEIPGPVASPAELSQKQSSAAGDSQMNAGEEAIHDRDSNSSLRQPTMGSLMMSTFLSLAVVLVLLVALRYLLPTVLEVSRYSWHRGQLRAEYEIAGQQLERVSWEGLTSVSQSVARRVNPSVVHITTVSRTEAELERAGLNHSRRTLSGQGSGVIADSKGHILTNYHVLDDGERITVILSDERSYNAELIGVDRLTDLAVLKIPAEDLFPIVWGDSDSIAVGSPVWAVGSPFGLTGSITFGILSSKHRLDLTGTGYGSMDNNNAAPRYSDLMQSDVAVNPGNSGGPLVNGRGEMIGINTAIIGETYRGVSFSIPSDVARRVFEDILATGRVRRGWLGVELGPVAKDSVDAGTVPNGALVRSIISDESPAAKAGIEVGDLILALNGEKVKGVDELINRIGKTEVGTRVTLTIDRSAQQLQIEVTIGERPEFTR